MNAEAAKLLREPFATDQIGKLPRLTCKACSEKRCQEHKKGECKVCGNWISPKHIHLDYVGHAATTDRLLKADPEWSWRPFSADELVGVNAQKGELWIWLTVAGTTRPGVGDGETAKIRIGDAIRNAAMRFGVALDLWAKEDLHHEPDESGADEKVSDAKMETLTQGINALCDVTGKQAPEVVREIVAEHGDGWNKSDIAVDLVTAWLRRKWREASEKAA